MGGGTNRIHANHSRYSNDHSDAALFLSDCFVGDRGFSEWNILVSNDGTFLTREKRHVAGFMVECIIGFCRYDFRY